ncbi:hypothetical protein DFH06DRAFT_1180132 [Mycena polygramma]|nr:hypothetical protein DFH06DRAFT_1180132 [Mycena polygramma]
MDYIDHICSTNQSFVGTLCGIPDIRQHLAQTCRSLTISVYWHSFEKEYAAQCAHLIEYATSHAHRKHYQLIPGANRHRTQTFTVGTECITSVINNLVPHVTALHFVLIDCNATYAQWGTGGSCQWFHPEYPLSLTELHVTFAYTAPPPILLQNAPRGTFFPPPSYSDLPLRCRFNGVRRLVVRDANADFVAFLVTACPLLERIESTAEVGVDDIPEDVPDDVKARLVFMRLPRTTAWPGVTDGDTKPIPKRLPQTFAEWDALSPRWVPSGPDAPPRVEEAPPKAPEILPEVPNVALRTRRNALWRFVTEGFQRWK